MLRFTIMSFLVLFSFNASLAQTTLFMGEEIFNDGAGHDQFTKGKNNHYFFAKSYFNKKKILRVYSLETNSLVTEYATTGEGENTFALPSEKNLDFYYLIEVNEDITKITKRDSQNEVVAEANINRQVDGHSIYMARVGELEGNEILLLSKKNETSSSYVYLETQENKISSELKHYFNLSEGGFKSIKYFDDRAFAISEEEGRKESTLKLALINENLEAVDPIEFTFSPDYYYYSTTHANKFTPGAIVLGNKLNFKTAAGEFFLIANGKFIEFTIPLKSKMNLNTGDIVQYKEHLLVFGTYKKKKELGYFTIKLSYSGEVLETTFVPLYEDYRSEAKPRMDDLDFETQEVFFNESNESVTCVIELIETYVNLSGERSTSFATHTNTINIDGNGKLIWRNDFKLNSAYNFKSGSFYAMHDGILYLAYGELDINLAVKTVSSEGKEIETKEYRADRDFSYQDESRLFDDGFLILKCYLGKRKGVKFAMKYTSVQLW